MSREIAADYTVVGHFNVQARAMFTLGGFLTFKDVDFDYLVTREILRHGGDGAVNVRIVDQMNGTDILINAALSATGGLPGYAITGAVRTPCQAPAGTSFREDTPPLSEA